MALYFLVCHRLHPAGQSTDGLDRRALGGQAPIWVGGLISLTAVIVSLLVRRRLQGNPKEKPCACGLGKANLTLLASWWERQSVSGTGKPRVSRGGDPGLSVCPYLPEGHLCSIELSKGAFGN